VIADTDENCAGFPMLRSSKPLDSSTTLIWLIIMSLDKSLWT